MPVLFAVFGVPIVVVMALVLLLRFTVWPMAVAAIASTPPSAGLAGGLSIALAYGMFLFLVADVPAFFGNVGYQWLVNRDQ